MSRGTEGCWLRAQAGSHSLLLTPERVGQTELAAAADVWVLPRRAADAQRILTAASPPALLLAGVAASEWRAGAWSELRQAQLQRGAGIRSHRVGPDPRTHRAGGSAGCEAGRLATGHLVDIADGCEMPALNCHARARATCTEVP